MSFKNRSQFIQAAASEKIILAHVEANTRLINFVNAVGFIYTKVVPYFPIAVKFNDTVLNRAASQGAMVAGSFHYSTNTSTLSIWLTDNSDPLNSEIISTYRLFFSNNPISLPWDLSDDSSADVYYDGRISAAPGFKQKIGIDQSLNSVVGSGDLTLENNDAALDEIFDRFVFDNKDVKIYSWNRDLLASESQIIFKGKITNKRYESNSVTFTVKDVIYELQQNIPQSVFTEDDSVSNSVLGNIKRWVYGRVDGLKLQSTDQINLGYPISGTVSFNTLSKTLTGVGTAFLSQTSPGDKITIQTLQFTIESVDSNTQITLSKKPEYALIGQTAILLPEVPVIIKNRTQFVADHACAVVTKTVANALQFNRIQLSDTIGIEAGDFITFVSTGERKEVKNVAPNNIIVLRDNVIALPALGTSATREPIQRVYINGVTVNPSDYTVSSLPLETKITLAPNAEFNIASNREYSLSMTFTNGSRTITYSGDASLSQLLKPRDYIRPANLLYTTFYEILAVADTQITLRLPFANSTITDTITTKSPNYIGDTTLISVDVLGKTKDGLPNGDWIRTSAETVLDLLGEVNITSIDTTTFDEVSLLVPQLVSVAFPLNGGKTLTSIKAAIDLVNKSTRCTLSLDKDLQLKYESVIVQSPSVIQTISDSDVIKWSIRSTNGKNYRNSIFSYRHSDVDNGTLEESAKVATYSSKFVERYVGTNQTLEDSIYIYDTTAAKISSEREVYYNSLGISTITIDTDLRLEGLEIGDSVILDLKRLYKRFGDASTRKKLVTCTGKTVTGKSIQLEFSDYGNTFNTSAFITDNEAPEYDLSEIEDRIINGYITDPQGIVGADEDTDKTNLIS